MTLSGDRLGEPVYNLNKANAVIWLLLRDSLFSGFSWDTYPTPTPATTSILPSPVSHHLSPT